MTSSIIRAATIQTLLKPKPHPLDASRVRHTVSLGDEAGISKIGIHKTTLEPGMKSSVEHFHDVEEEWIYILEGSGTLLCAGVGEDAPVAPGDFVGFPANGGQPHALQAGANGISYLCGGSRVPVDLCHYPLVKKALLVNRAQNTSKFMDEE